jgi:hypothetical protein
VTADTNAKSPQKSPHPGLSFGRRFGKMADMRNEGRGDVWKVWLYAASAVVLGAWISPLLYNAGKALAEVSLSKATNGPLEWLASLCRTAEFPRFYEVGLLLAAGILFLPWMEWTHTKRSESQESHTGPWLLRLPDRARSVGRGQPLRKNLRGLWQACSGFLLVSGLLLSMGVALVPAGFFTMFAPSDGLGTLAFQTLLRTLPLALMMELWFRGITMGIFLRAMRPASALGMSAAYFALVLMCVPPPGMNVADPEAAGIGFEMLRLLAGRFADWQAVVGTFVPLLALGGVLAYARWCTASLCLPVGLHTGWLFSKGMLAKLSLATGANESALSGGLLQQGLVPLITILLAGILAHFLTAKSEDERAFSP